MLRHTSLAMPWPLAKSFISHTTRLQTCSCLRTHICLLSSWDNWSIRNSCPRVHVRHECSYRFTQLRPTLEAFALERRLYFIIALTNKRAFVSSLKLTFLERSPLRHAKVMNAPTLLQNLLSSGSGLLGGLENIRSSVRYEDGETSQVNSEHSVLLFKNEKAFYNWSRLLFGIQSNWIQL